jgi:hypothetical protein
MSANLLINSETLSACKMPVLDAHNAPDVDDDANSTTSDSFVDYDPTDVWARIQADDALDRAHEEFYSRVIDDDDDSWSYVSSITTASDLLDLIDYDYSTSVFAEEDAYSAAFEKWMDDWVNCVDGTEDVDHDARVKAFSFTMKC